MPVAGQLAELAQAEWHGRQLAGAVGRSA